MSINRNGHGKAGNVAEAKTFVRASVSSGVATLVDGVLYQAVLFVTPSYVLAALLGAVGGAVTNFVINRLWAFPATNKRLLPQVAQYAFASTLTYVALQTCLFLLIEIVHVKSRIAWLPAKIIAWAGISYPLQRLFVFAPSRSRGTSS